MADTTSHNQSGTDFVELVEGDTKWSGTVTINKTMADAAEWNRQTRESGRSEDYAFFQTHTEFHLRSILLHVVNKVVEGLV